MQCKLLSGKPTILFFLFCSISFGQEESKLSIGVHGGVGGAKLYRTDTYNEPVHRPKLGFTSGISLQYIIKQRLSLRAELNYERKGNQATYYLGYSINPHGETKTSNLDYFTLPITAKIEFAKKKVSFFYNTGLYLGYLVKALDYNLVYDSREAKTKYVEKKIDENNRFDYGLVTGLGLDIPIKNNFQLKHVKAKDLQRFLPAI